MRSLRRSRTDRMIGGVCGGIAATLGIDAVLLRIAVVALALSGGVGVLAYLAAWILIPEAGGDDVVAQAPPPSRHAVAIAVGAALIGLGALLVLRTWVPWLGAQLFWPLVVIAAGVLMLVSARR
jgi:phage shock protein C